MTQSTDLHFLDEIASTSENTDNTTDNTATDADTAQAPSNTETPTGPDTTVTAPVAESTSESKYSNVKAGYATLEEAEAAEGKLHTVAEFAGLLTLRNVSERNMGLDGIVKDAAIYTAIRAVRSPLPVVLVADTAMLADTAFEAWDARPTRGEGATSTGGRLSDDDLLKAAATARDNVDALTRRKASIETRLAKADTLKAKRVRQMQERFTGVDLDALWTKVDEWASANEATLADTTQAQPQAA